jgi:hypothetical protein
MDGGVVIGGPCHRRAGAFAWGLADTHTVVRYAKPWREVLCWEHSAT